MKRMLGLVFALSISTAIHAQTPFEPPEEVASFERTIGHWEGSGQVWPGPDAEPMPWTASEHVEWVLDGFYALADLEVRAEVFPVAMAMRSVYGWDEEQLRYFVYTASNMSEASLTDAHWVGNTLVMHKSIVEDGNVIVERIATTYGDGEYEFVVERGVGVDDFFVHARGKFERVDTPDAPPTVPASAPIRPTPKPMTKVQGLVGDWNVVGMVRPMVGVPEMPVTATETIRALWGGSCLMNEVVGTPGPTGQFRGLGFLTWSAGREAFQQVWFDNMGLVQSTAGNFAGRDLVFQFAGREYGTPIVARSTMSFDEEGHLVGVFIDRMGPQGEAERSFDVEYSAAE